MRLASVNLGMLDATDQNIVEEIALIEGKLRQLQLDAECAEEAGEIFDVTEIESLEEKKKTLEQGRQKIKELKECGDPDTALSQIKVAEVPIILDGEEASPTGPNKDQVRRGEFNRCGMSDANSLRLAI